MPRAKAKIPGAVAETSVGTELTTAAPSAPSAPVAAQTQEATLATETAAQIPGAVAPWRLTPDGWAQA